MTRRTAVSMASAFLMLMVSLLLPLEIQAQNTGYLRRYAANFVTFGTPAEIATTLPPFGSRPHPAD